MDKAITDVITAIDPCGMYLREHNLNTIIASCGALPSCIDCTSEVSYLEQVKAAIGAVNMEQHILHDFECDEDGCFSSSDSISKNGVVYAIAAQQRYVDGHEESIFYYANGMVIVVDYCHAEDVYNYYAMNMTN